MARRIPPPAGAGGFQVAGLKIVNGCPAEKKMAVITKFLLTN
jgi:hypothetical protein